jgi:hypothetical protein
MLLTLMRRLTACVSRRREYEAARREGVPAGSKAEDRPDYAGRLHALLGGLLPKSIEEGDNNFQCQ